MIFELLPPATTTNYITSTFASKTRKRRERASWKPRFCCLSFFCSNFYFLLLLLLLLTTTTTAYCFFCFFVYRHLSSFYLCLLLFCYCRYSAYMCVCVCSQPTSFFFVLFYDVMGDNRWGRMLGKYQGKQRDGMG